MKRAVVQVISAMAHHGYLEQPGGEAMMEYVVQQCALPPESEVRGASPPAAGHGAPCCQGPGRRKLPGPREAGWVAERRPGLGAACFPRLLSRALQPESLPLLPGRRERQAVHLALREAFLLLK